MEEKFRAEVDKQCGRKQCHLRGGKNGEWEFGILDGPGYSVDWARLFTRFWKLDGCL